MYRKGLPFAIVLTLCITCTLSQNNTLTELRVVHLVPDSSSSPFNCPVEQCYSLMDVIRNQSYFFDSNTTLQLSQGRYDINEQVGQLVVTNITNFKIISLSVYNESASIMCLPGATLGFAFIHCHGIQISNIEISNCSALLNSDVLFVNDSYLSVNNDQLGHNITSCSSLDNVTLCYIFLAFLNSTEIRVHHTAIQHSKGVGFFGFGNRHLHLSEIVLAHNDINCIYLIVSDANTNFSLSNSRIMYGKANNAINLASGLNILTWVKEGHHDIRLTKVHFENNRAQLGSLHLDVYMFTERVTDALSVKLLLSELTFIQRSTAGLAISLKFKIDLGYDSEEERRARNRASLDYLYLGGERFNNLYSIVNILNPSLFGYDFVQPRNAIIELNDVHVLGGCIRVADSNVRKRGNKFVFEMNNVTIRESRCFTALDIANDLSEGYIQLVVSALSIADSYHNILSFNIGNDELQFTDLENTTLASNRGSVSVISGKVTFKGLTNISDNIAQNYESIFHISESSKVFFQGETNFIHNTGRQGGAISAYSGTVKYGSGTTLNFDGNVTFIGNFAYMFNGGAISLKEGATMSLKRSTHILLKDNTAYEYGGAIYVEDEGLRDGRDVKCFIDTDSTHTVEFESNVAGVAGAALFGGMIDTCKGYSTPPRDVLVFNSDNSVSSKPYAVYLCIDSTINKGETEAHVEAFPGQTLEIVVATAGQRYGLAPASVRAETDFEIIDHLQKVQDTQNVCTTLKYTVKSSRKNETIFLSVERQSNDIVRLRNGTLLLPSTLHKFKVLISFLDCPLGFVIDNKQNTCLCHDDLVHHGAQCNFTSYKVNRSVQQWIGILGPTNTIVVHQYCHLDYCNSYALSVNLSSPDEQCDFNRSGVLCGACQPGLSHVLGTSRCKKCSSLWLLLIAVFALAGLLLVAFLMLLNLTVSTGTINGLIFYANIVRANNAAFFPSKTSNSFLSWFIAWLNLDLGVEMCFYDGLDAYAKTWLQFAFPLYIWLLVALIILSSRYSITVAKLCNQNAVQVLATLFILSYAKLLRLTIVIFQPTQLMDGSYVWYYDGNINYLGKKHTPLMIIGLSFFIVFLIPYTVVLFGIQWLQQLSHYKVFRWVNTFKPLLDAYTGPYKDNHRYWTGLLLLVRIGLFTVFSTNVKGDPSTNLLAVIIIIICLLAYLALFSGVYKTKLVNVLEYFFLLNLVILSAAVFYTRTLNGPVHTVTQVSVGISVFTATIIVFHHALSVVLKVSTLDAKIAELCVHLLKRKKKTQRVHEHNVTDNVAALELAHKVTYSVIELQEPLINSQ